MKKAKRAGFAEFEQIPIHVDKWQFDRSSLKIKGIKEIKSIPYGSSGAGTGVIGVRETIVNNDDRAARERSCIYRLVEPKSDEAAIRTARNWDRSATLGVCRR